MANRLKKFIRKLPFLAIPAKFFYDWRSEKKQQKDIENILKNGLPFTDRAPDFYSVGHEPTIRCNLKCKMCYQGQTRALRQSELDANDILKMYERLNRKTNLIKLVGGEPMMRADIFELIGFWDKTGTRVVLQTNCTLINERNIDTLKKFKNLKDIVTSLDGPPAVHDRIRGVPGTFDRLKKAVSLVKKERPDIVITVFATLVEDNMDNLCELVDTTKDLELGSINILFEQVYSEEDVKKSRTILKTIFGWEERDYRLNTQIRNPVFEKGLHSKELKEKLKRARIHGAKKGCFVNFVPFNYYQNLDKYLGEKPARSFCLKLLAPELRINQEGNVIWCDIIEKSFGSLVDKTPDEIWLSDDYQKFREYLFKNSLPICKRCCKANYL